MDAIIERLKKYLKESTPEERDKIWAEVNEVQIKGPTFKEYLTTLNDYLVEAHKAPARYYVISEYEGLPHVPENPVFYEAASDNFWALLYKTEKASQKQDEFRLHWSSFDKSEEVLPLINEKYDVVLNFFEQGDEVYESEGYVFINYSSKSSKKRKPILA